jgi:hypothetical protein
MMVLAREIRTYSYDPPLMGESVVPGLNQVLMRMLATDRGTRYHNAAEACEAMKWVAQDPDGDLCNAMLAKLVAPSMRALFLRLWEKHEGTPWEDTPECGQRYLEREVKRNRKAANWLIRERLAAGDSRAWDVTALCTILLWSQVHPLTEEEAPEDYADVSHFREWRNELAHSVAWGAEKAAFCADVMLRFIERHPPIAE